jgi:hypothetical protein
MAKMIPKVRDKNGIALEGFLRMIKDNLGAPGVVLNISRKGVIVDCKVDDRAVDLLQTKEVAAVDERFQVFIIGA